MKRIIPSASASPVDNGSERGNHGHNPDCIDVTIIDIGEWLEGYARRE